MAPDLVAEFVRSFNEESNRRRRDRDGRRASLNRELKESAARTDTLLESVASGGLKGPSVQAKLEALEPRQPELARELAGLKDEPVRLHPNLAALCRRKVATLHDLLESDATRTEAVEITRSLVDHVTFRPHRR
jgi:site-specific DNA recombinase